MADDPQDFLSGPLAQILIPLISAGASAYSPRYGGAAVQGGLGAIGALQNYRMQNLRMQDERDKDKRYNASVDQLIKGWGGGQGQAPAQQAPAGGSTTGPLQATSKAVDAASGGGDEAQGGQPPSAVPVARPGTTPAVSASAPHGAALSAALAAIPSGGTPNASGGALGGLPPEMRMNLIPLLLSGPSGLAKASEIANDYLSKSALKEQAPPKYHFNDFTNEYGDQVTSRIDENSGNQTQFYRAGAAPEKQDDMARERAAWQADPKNANKPLSQFYVERRTPVVDPLQFVPDSQGNMFVGDRRTGNLRPANITGGGAMPPATAQVDATGEPAPPNGPKFGRTGQSVMSPEDAKLRVDQIAVGNQPPDLRGEARTGAITAIRNEAARRGLNLSNLQLEWQGAQQLAKSLNGPQQVQARQNLGFVDHALDQVQASYDNWRQIAPDLGFKKLNRAELVLAANSPDQTVSSAAQTLLTQINDAVFAVQGVYSKAAGTDKSLDLAAENLKGEWNDKTFRDSVTTLRRGVGFRRAAMGDTRTAGVGGGQNLYDRGAQAGNQQQAPSQSAPSGGGGAPIVQVSPSTGRKRQSLDGGQTWQEIR